MIKQTRDAKLTNREQHIAWSQSPAQYIQQPKKKGKVKIVDMFGF